MISRIGSGGPWEDVVGYSRAVVAGPWILVSGCTAVVDGELRHVDDAYGQARTAFEIALKAIAKAGGSPPHVVRTRMYLRNLADAEAVGRAHAELFLDVRPAASMIGVAGFIDPRMLVEIEVEAYRPEGS
ncbi:RidA family protein [Actinomadura sp. HBU206391]|uniref:RidA family protein n=1 Tax=Actinomadura sp. HBU206391 TaxID=2731692 RepID=UPI00164FD68A|nr:RidA family protein [Actinomadura sp. HBU206391]MBC6463443.1 RidA family protein [Actinomadura sp. HBU206391]